eukprot:7472720-Pyramimonas_sp.AAC.1
MVGEALAVQQVGTILASILNVLKSPGAFDDVHAQRPPQPPDDAPDDHVRGPPHPGPGRGDPFRDIEAC